MPFQRIVNQFLLIGITTRFRGDSLVVHQSDTGGAGFLTFLNLLGSFGLAPFQFGNEILEVHFSGYGLAVRQRHPVVIVFRRRVRARSEQNAERL